MGLRTSSPAVDNPLSAAVLLGAPQNPLQLPSCSPTPPTASASARESLFPGSQPAAVPGGFLSRSSSPFGFSSRRRGPHADPRPSFPKSRSQGSEQAATGSGLLARRGQANWRRRENWSGTSLRLFLRNQELAPIQLVQLQSEQYIFPALFN